jgi:glutamine amidotransferase-like uncharacterized protein
MEQKRSIISLLVVFVLATVLCFIPVKASALNVGIVCTYGVASDKMLAIFRAVNSMGHTIKGIDATYIKNHLVNASDWANFDVIILPAGTAETFAEYESTTTYGGVCFGMNNSTVKANLANFVKSKTGGGALIAIEQGAKYLVDKMKGSTGSVVLPSTASYTTDSSSRTLKTMTINLSSFYLGPSNNVSSQLIFKSKGGASALSAGSGQTVIATNSGSTVVAGISSGNGRVVLCAYDPELRTDSLADWTQWDNWLGLGTHTNSAYCWQFLGKLIEWAKSGTPSGGVPTTPEPSGVKVAVLADWIYKYNNISANWGGAAPDLIPAIGRAVEYSGYVPLAIRMEDVTSARLTSANFKCLVIPGGYSYGYKVVLGSSISSGGGKAIYDFLNTHAGGVFAICAGSYYLSDYVQANGLSGTTYRYLPIFSGGIDNGPIISPCYQHSTDVVAGGYTVIKVSICDPDSWMFGSNYDQYQMIFGGGYKYNGSKTISVTYTDGTDYSGSPNLAGQAAAIRFKIGGGHVYLSGPHPEALACSSADWIIWDEYDYYDHKITGITDNPWDYVKKVFDNWLNSTN